MVKKIGTLTFNNKSLGTFYRVIYSVIVCISHYTGYFCDSRMSKLLVVVVNTPYIWYGLRIQTGTERTPSCIVDIFDTTQTVPNTGIQLKVDEEQRGIAQGSKRQAGGYGPHVCNLSGPRLPDTPHAQQKTPLSTRLDRKTREDGRVSGDQQFLIVPLIYTVP